MPMSIPYFERRLSATFSMIVVICDAGVRLARECGGFIIMVESGAPITKPDAGTLSPVAIR